VDKLTRTYFEELLAGRKSHARHMLEDFYGEIKKGSLLRGHARMVCLSDATGSSMCGGLWNQTKKDITTMIQRIKELGGDSFEILWIAYRDYSDSQLIEKSSWTSDAGILQGFVNGIVCGGGLDSEEAVERALLEARREHDMQAITRVLLIADAPPHSEKKGQKLAAHNHVLETDYMLEAWELKRREVPVFCFTVGACEATMSAFGSIASTTGGTADVLSASKLIDVVCTSALQDIGGSELVAEYQSRYMS